jgi:hypothetical protein
MHMLAAALAVSASLSLAAGAASADDYLTKDGKLAKQLKAVELQGGFAGNTGVRYTVEADGSWTSEALFNQKSTPKDKGKLTKKELTDLAATLKKFDLLKLPEKTGQVTGANPHSIDLEFGTHKASLIGRTPPKLDPNEPAGTPESRFAGIWEGIAGLLKPPAKK